MTATNPHDEVPYGPQELSHRLATNLAQNPAVDDATVERVRNSPRPLDETIRVDTTDISDSQTSVLYEESIRGFACTALAFALEENIDSLLDVKRGNYGHSLGLITHPAVLAHGNRLFHPPSLAIAYQYGYWLHSGAIVEGGHYAKTFDVDANSSYEFRRNGLSMYTDESPTDDYDYDTIVDEDAVAAFADRVTTDDVKWEQYIPLQRTKIVPSYRISTVAESLDPGDFPDRPDRKPGIKDRFETSREPRVGDFIRQAILRRLEEKFESIININTGPGTWTTDEITLTVQPTEWDKPGIESNRFCPPGVTVKLSEYGYRPIDAWYDTPDVGHTSEDSIPVRQIKFARSSTLQQWSQASRYQAFSGDEIQRLKEHVPLVNFDWETLIPSLRTHILRHEDLLYEIQ